MSERIPLYFPGQCPPPPPPPPPLPSSSPSYRYGTAAAISLPAQESIQLLDGQQLKIGYSYGHTFGVPGLPIRASIATSLHSTVQNRSTTVHKSGRDGKPNLKNNTNHDTNQTKKIDETKIRMAVCMPTQGSQGFSCENSKIQNTKKIKQSVAWTCEPCQIKLESEKAFKSHRKSHVKCSNCSFEGAPKVVKAHYQAKHGKFSGSGFKTISVGVPGCRVQKFKICVGNRPEDIKRWIAERRKRFPRTNPMNLQATNSTNIAENTSEGASISFDTATLATPPGKMQEQTPATTDVTSPTTTGLTSLLAGYGSSSDDDNGDDDREDRKSSLNTSAQKIPKREGDVLQTKINRNKVISAGMESTKDIAVAPISNSVIKASELQKEENRCKISRPCRFYFRKGSCRNGNNCRFSHDESRFGHQFAGDQHHNNYQQQHQGKSSVSPSSTGCSENRKTNKRKRGVHTSSDTLLRKLVQNDMERESALSVQLLKFIVDNNFFLDDGRSRKQHERVHHKRIAKRP